MRRLAVLAVLLACRPPSLPAATDGAGPGTGTSADPGGSGTTGCMNSGDCETDGVCVADYAPTTGELGGERGPARCVDMDACIAALDLDRWCFDHRSCCGDLRCRTVDGICEPPGLATSSSGGDTDTGTTTDTGATTAATTGTTADTTTTGTTADTTTTGTTGTTDTTDTSSSTGTG